MRNNVQPKVVDLFCSVGALSHGLIREGFNVVAGIDNDESCRYGFEHNNKAKFIHKDIRDVSAEDINSLFGDEDDAPRVLVGCAPCQPFSKLNINKSTQKEMEPLEQFAPSDSESKAWHCFDGKRPRSCEHEKASCI